MESCFVIQHGVLLKRVGPGCDGGSEVSGGCVGVENFAVADVIKPFVVVVFDALLLWSQVTEVEEEEGNESEEGEGSKHLEHRYSSCGGWGVEG